MRNLPPLIELKAFEAAARHLSFKRAAVELHVSPTAISHQIKMLEEYCQCSLFRRHPRPLALTRAGAILFPGVRNGLDEFARTLASIREKCEPKSLKLTTTSSFATNWLVPRLSDWRSQHPDLALEVIATDSIVDLQAVADFSVRYMHKPPSSSELVTHELVRDNFIVVCSPQLLPEGQSLKSLADLQGFTLVHTHWSPTDLNAPTWPRWFEHASSFYAESPNILGMKNLTFHEEMHAIDAATNAAGVLIVSDLLVARNLENCTLVKAMEFTLPGYGFYVTYRKDHPHKDIFESFASWARSKLIT